MKVLVLLQIATLFCISSYAQIITELSSLPDVDDQLTYKALDNISSTYLTSGEGVTWDFTEMSGQNIITESYLPAEDGEAFSQFPNSDMLVTFNGVEAYANRNTTNIEIVGVSLGDFIEGVDLPMGQQLDQPYVIRRAPVGFEDTFSGSTSFNFTLGGEALAPLTELLAGVVGEGATVDSLRVAFNFSRSEEVDSYGTAVFLNESVEVLRIVQSDEIDYSIELFVVTGFIDTWINVSEFLDTEEFGLESQTLTNYVFLDATSKEFILEVNVNELDQTSTGRYKSSLETSLQEISPLALNIYPNPTSDILNIQADQLSNVFMLNELGQELDLQVNYLRNGAQISLEHVPSGMYTLISEFKNGSKKANRVSKQ